MRQGPPATETDFDVDEPTRIDGLAAPSPARIAERMKRGICPSDRVFDRFLPRAARELSGDYWTPLAAAVRAAEWLDAVGARTLLDIGSGPGKLCIATALAGNCHVSGLEHRTGLVETARALARAFAVDDRVTFIEGALGETPLPAVDAYYLFNPFGENLLGVCEMEEHVELSADRYRRDVALVEDLLLRAPLGTCVVTYNGYGGSIPPSYRELNIERGLPNVLKMWRKERADLIPPTG